MRRAPASTDSDADLSVRAADAELVRRVAEQDPAAARAVVDAHLDRIYRFAYRMLGDAAGAEDVAQEAMVRLWQQAESWQGRAKLRTWLFRVARNLCIDRLRARRVRAKSPPAEGVGEVAHAQTLLEEREQSALVARAVGTLPDRQREALVLVYYEGLRNDEAAEVLETSVEALESLLARARRQLGVKLRSVGGADHE